MRGMPLAVAALPDVFLILAAYFVLSVVLGFVVGPMLARRDQP